MKKFLLLLLLAFVACQPSKKEESTNDVAYQAPEHHSEELAAVFDAHGGYANWSRMKSLSYVKGAESTITNLENRKIRVESPEQTIGFDGEQVWVTPDSVDASRARFYHNLYFYFYAMPFVVGDPGAYYEVVGPRELAGKTYNGIKISYRENVGDAPDDNYIIWSDPETGKMEWLMYTVTYRSGKPSDNYSLINYSGWEEFNGVLLPTKLQWFRFENDMVGDPRGEGTLFQNIQLTTTYPADSLFEKPANAQIAPLNGGSND